MRPPELTAPEQRVLGCLIEKRRTTPDTYPLSINALRLACNQSTNRDPVVDYDEHTVREAAQRLSRRGLARLASGAGSRAIKYRHLAEEGLGLGDAELAIVCVLLLRGPQTPGELKARTDRLAHIESLAEIERLLDALIDRGFVSRLPRRPGLKEDRFIHLLTAEEDEAADTPTPAHVSPLPRYEPPPPPKQEAANGLAERVSSLEHEVAELRTELRALREALGE
ncbi:MAG TPA: YceH family protein [Solirubrobacteraceae bacterium]|nr:YceH family protein [Solirubrobacteraceae bacterium]